MKSIYINELKEALLNSSVEYPKAFVEKIERRYNLGLEAGLSEEEIEEMLGSVDDLVDQYLDSLVDEDDINENINSSKLYNIEIDTIRDDITIDVGDANNIDYEVISANPEYYDISFENDELKIKYKKIKFLGLNRQTRGHIKIKIPQNVLCNKLKLNSTSGDIIINDTVNVSFMRVNSVSGEINFDAIKGNEIKLTTVNGDINGISIDGNEVTIDTVSGDMCANIINCENLLLSSVSGDFNIAHVKANVKASSVTGDIKINGADVGVNVKKTIKGLFR